MSEISQQTDYRLALTAIKQRIQSAQTRAVLAVKAELLNLYWDICRQLDAWQRERAWGAAVVEQMAQDLQASYLGMKGFSRTSLFAMQQFYAFFSPQFEVVPQPVGQMPWGHVRSLLAKIESVELVVEYALRDIHKPMGVSAFITKDIPLSVQSQLPTAQEIERELTALIHDDENQPNE